MPKRRSIKTSSPSDFEPKRKNPISLGSDSNIDNDLKPLTIGGVPTGLEISNDTIASNVENFVTLKEKTQQLNVSVIKGNKIPSLGEPQIIFQNSNATDNSSGLWLNVFTDGTTFLKANDGQFAMAGTLMSFIVGDDSGEDFLIKSGTFTSNVDIFRVDNAGSVFLKEQSSAVSSETAFGQIWVKNSTPNELYFRTDAGDNIQITSGTSLAGGGASALNDLSDVTYSSGDLTISSLDTIVAGANLTIDAVGDIILDADGGDVIFKDSGTTFASTSSAGMMIETGGTQVVYAVDQIMYDGDDLLQYNTNELTITNYLKIAESASANSDSAGKGQLWVKNDTPNNLYFTNDAGNDVQITNGSSLAGGSGGTQCWTFTLGGYMLNNNSSTNYYTSFYTNYFYWLNTDSSPTSIAYTDAYTYNYKAPKAGVLTKICVTARATRTDPFKIYVYKAAPATGDTSTSATLIGTSDTITPPATNQLVVVDTTISSSNTFSAGDALYVWLKKDSTSGTQSIYFTITIQGDYS